MSCSVRRALAQSFLVLAPALVATDPTTAAGHLRQGRHLGLRCRNWGKRILYTPAELDAYFNSYYQVSWPTRRSPDLRWGCTGTWSIPILRPPPTPTLGIMWTTPSPRLRRGTPESDPGSENHPTHRDSGLSVARMGIGSDSLLRRVVSVARSDSSKHLRNGDLHGLPGTSDGTVLPLPWNPVYKSAWQTFLTALAARYGSNPRWSPSPSRDPLPRQRR